MITNADITVFNKRYDAEERTELFFPSRIKGVSFFKKHGASVQSQGLSSADVITIRIPIDADMDGKTYIEAMTYEALSDDEYAGYWTLQPGDLIVKGLVEDDEPISEVDLDQAYSDVVRVVNFTDNTDRASDTSKHWRVGGV